MQMREANVENAFRLCEFNYTQSGHDSIVRTERPGPRSSSIGGIGEGFESSVLCESSVTDRHRF
jgi:hypothetical protein